MSDSPPPEKSATVGVVEVLIVRTPEFYRRVALHADDGAQVRACLLLAADELEELHANAPPSWLHSS